MAWYPDEAEYEWHWIASVSVLVLSVAMFLVGKKMSTRISFDILEHCDPKTIKESSKNAWTNIAVTSALVLTMVMAMLQVDPISPVSFTLTNSELLQVQQWYVALCMGSLLFNLLCIIVCVVNLSYVDPLTEVNALKFFLANADTIGDPVVLMAESFIFFIAAIFVWCLGTYGLASGMLMLLASIVFVLSVANVWTNRAKFTPGNVDWTQDTSLWRREYTTGGVMANIKNEAVVKAIKRFGEVAMAAEKEEEDSKDGLHSKIC